MDIPTTSADNPQSTHKRAMGAGKKTEEPDLLMAQAQRTSWAQHKIEEQNDDAEGSRCEAKDQQSRDEARSTLAVLGNLGTQPGPSGFCITHRCPFLGTLCTGILVSVVLSLTIYNFLGRADVSEPVMRWCNWGVTNRETRDTENHDGSLILLSLRSQCRSEMVKLSAVPAFQTEAASVPCVKQLKTA